MNRHYNNTRLKKKKRQVYNIHKINELINIHYIIF
jgi:hypothetical protein